MPYAYQASADGGAFEDLADFASMVRILNEGRAGREATTLRGPYTPGAVAVAHRPYMEKFLQVECQVRATDPAGAITHPDGEQGHISENLSNLNRLLGGAYGPAMLRRDWPDQGVVERPIEGIGEPFISQNSRTLVWPVMSRWPAWKSTSVSSSAANPDVQGHFPIYDAVVTFTGGTDVSITVGSYQLGVSGAVPAGGVKIDVGAGTVVQVTGGADYSEFLTENSPEWLVLLRGVNSVTYGGGGTYLIEWYEQWP